MRYNKAMKFTIPHKQTEQEAITHVTSLLAQHHAQLEQQVTELKEEWQGNVLNFGFTAQGAHIEGTLTVRDQAFDVYAKLPLMLKLFEGRIERTIKEQIAQTSR